MLEQYEDICLHIHAIFLVIVYSSIVRWWHSLLINRWALWKHLYIWQLLGRPPTGIRQCPWKVKHRINCRFFVRVHFIFSHTSIICVRFMCGLKNNAIDLWDIRSRAALMNRIPCIMLISFGFGVMLNNAFVFLHNENDINNSPGKMEGKLKILEMVICS